MSAAPERADLRHPTGAAAVEAAIGAAAVDGRPALVGYLTAGLPTLDAFAETLLAVSDEVDVLEVGVPFSDPVADGPTIQASSRRALENGVSLRWIVETLRTLPRAPSCPLVLMSYLNPLLAYGIGELAAASDEMHVGAWIVPDLPFEESGPVRDAMRAPGPGGEIPGVGLVQLVSPLTGPERMERLAAATEGFLYAVTVAGTTGGRALDMDAVAGSLARVRAAAQGRPVCAGFGIRSREQVERLAPHVDGVVVGSALVEALDESVEAGLAFLRGLKSG